MIDFLSAGGAPGNLHYAALDQMVHSMKFDRRFQVTIGQLGIDRVDRFSRSGRRAARSDVSSRGRAGEKAGGGVAAKITP
jgi:hypothetical protein